MDGLASRRPGPQDRETEASFAAIKRAVIDRTGHHYYADKDELLRDRLGQRLRATGCRGLPDYLKLLDDRVAGAAEWRELEAEITIGETFFFRHTEQFAAVQTVILPEILARNAASRRLRIWSAGCAVGAEPYSVAILLERLLGDAIGDWSIDILGTDINHRILEKAQAGRFGTWAMRGMAETERARNFDATQDPRQWRIADRHRRHVRFVPHNLLDLLDGPSRPDRSGFDLILCRNVLIYFNPDRIAPMLSALGRCLGPQGWLMVGHSDAMGVLPPDLGIVELPGTIAFRPPACVPARFGHSALPEPEIHPEAPVAAPPRRRPPPPVPAAEPVLTPIAAIRDLADAGRLQEAAQACALAIGADPLDARLHFYDGVVAQAAGRRPYAEAALRRAIYLAGNMVMAHYHLGLLLLDGPAPEAGRRVMAQVAKLCEALPQAETLPESDGLTPRQLLDGIGMRLRPRTRP